MASLKNVKANPSIDFLSMTTSTNVGDVDPPDWIGDYFHDKDIPIDKLKEDKDTHQICEKYEKLSIYWNKKTGNRMTFCHHRKIEGRHNIPSFKIGFESSHHHPLKYNDVKKAVKHLMKKFGAQLRTSEVHLAIDYSMPNRINIHDRICLRIKPGKKRTFEIIESSHIYGATGSACRLEIYDKRNQLFSEKNIKVLVSISRVEIRMKIPRLGNFITSLEDVGAADWSWLYGPHFSFHYPNARSISLVGPKVTKMRICDLRDMMEEDYGVTSSNFFRDYLNDHRWLTAVTRKALAGYRWNPNAK